MIIVIAVALMLAGCYAQAKTFDRDWEYVAVSVY